MRSRLYEGLVRHRRLHPRQHAFSYRVFMPYLCLEELPELFDENRFWSARGRAIAEFRRSDFLGDPHKPLQDEVRRRIHEETGDTHRGPVFLLANLRYFGFSMNPVACYYCFDEAATQLQYLVAEVTNTPWDERHSYVLEAPPDGQWLQTRFAKQFHVSPFNPMDMQYHWRSNSPGSRLVLHLENHRQGEKIFDATLSLSERALTPASLNGILLRFPFMTARVGLAIYWQALRLFLKRTPFYPHPQPKDSGVFNE